MRRTYTVADFENAVERVRAAVPDASVTTDVIAGFPGETDSDHAESVQVMRSVGFSDAHVFPYSRRPGTSADHFNDQLVHAAKVERAAELRHIASLSAKRYRETEVGKVRDVLWEGGRNDTGLTENYLRVKSDGQQGAVRQEGAIERVRLIGALANGIMECRPV